MSAAVAAAAAAPAKAAAPVAPGGIFWARFVRHRPAVISAVVIALLGLASIFAGPIAVRDPLRIEMSHKFARPSPRVTSWAPTSSGATCSRACFTPDASR